jgi:hypothetical protein
VDGTGSAQDRHVAGRPSRRPLRIVGAALLGLLGGLAGFLAIGIQYSFAQIYGFSGYRGPLVVGLLAGVAAAAAFCGAAALLGSGRAVLVIGLVVLVAVTVGTVAASWLGGRAHDRGLQAAATACDARVGEYVVDLGAAVGDVVPQNGHLAVGRIDGTCSVLVATSGGDAGQLVAQAAEERGWREIGGQDHPTWSRDDVSVSFWVDANDDKSANVVELRAGRTL